MALISKGSGTSTISSRGSSTSVPIVRTCVNSRVKIHSQQHAVAGRVSAAGGIEDVNHPAIPRLRDIFFGGSGLQSPVEELTGSTPATAAEHLQDVDLLSEWSQRFLRQVPALPNGEKALQYLLASFEEIKAKAADGISSHRGVVEAYLQLALVDITAQCWDQRMQELEALHARLEQVLLLQLQESSQLSEIGRQMREARMALSGCRYLRLEAVNALAKQVHMLVDDCGHSPTLNVASLPQPHTTGINFSQLLQQGLNINLHNPTIKTLSDQEVQELQGLTWSQYHTKSQDLDLVGDWQFCFWYGSASLVPAPYGKFSTAQLAGLLTPDMVLGSLSNGVWGRSLVAAAIEVGVVLDSWAEPSRVMAGAGHVGSASAWMFLESQIGVRDNLQKVRQVALAVAAAAVTMVQQHQQQQ